MPLLSTLGGGSARGFGGIGASGSSGPISSLTYLTRTDSGDSSTNVAIIQKGIIRQTSSIPTSGRTLTKSIAQGLSLQEHLHLIEL